MKNTANPSGKEYDSFMITGISTACLYPLYTEVSLEALASLRVQSVELFINCSEELEPARVRQMRALADGFGVKILSVHPYTSPMEPMLFFSNYQRRFDEGREIYKKYYEAANILGADLVVFHGGVKEIRIGYDEYFERFGILVGDAAANGNKLCHENVSRCIGYCPEFFRALSEAIPDAEFVFDVKQAVRSGEDVFEFAGAMAGKIRHVHFSDHDEHNDCLPPGKGVFNTREFLSLIRKNGFDGGVIVELYRENFGEIVELFKGYQRLYTDVSTVSKNAEIIDAIRQT